MKIGIDPGLTGAIAILNDSLQCLAVHDIPTMALGVKRQQINAPALAKILKDCITATNGSSVTERPIPTVYLEEVHSMPGQGVTSMFSFGTSYGVVIGVCAALGFPLVLVKPRAWKKQAGLLGKQKDACRTLTQQLYPELDLSLKKHIGRADALAIARFGWMV